MSIKNNPAAWVSRFGFFPLREITCCPDLYLTELLAKHFFVVSFDASISRPFSRTKYSGSNLEKYLLILEGGNAGPH